MHKVDWTNCNPPERRRTYHFSGGQFADFENVTRIEFKQDGHRIETEDGKKAFVSHGWSWVEIDSDTWTA